jgi:hypothetical protein
MTCILGCRRHALFRGGFIPSQGRRVVLLHAAAFMIEFCRAVLCQGMTLRRSLRLPMCRPYIILFDPVALLEQEAEAVLGVARPWPAAFRSQSEASSLSWAQPWPEYSSCPYLELGLRTALQGLGQRHPYILLIGR